MADVQATPKLGQDGKIFDNQHKSAISVDNFLFVPPHWPPSVVVFFLVHVANIPD